MRGERILLFVHLLFIISIVPCARNISHGLGLLSQTMVQIYLIFKIVSVDVFVKHNLLFVAIFFKENLYPLLLLWFQ